MLTGMAMGQSTNSTTDADPGITPGSPFYGIEKAVESLEVRMATAIGGREMGSKALANNAQERLAEARSLAERNRTELASKAVDDYSNNLNRSRAMAQESNNTELSDRLDNISRGNVQALEQVREKVPEQARAGIDRAIKNSNKSIGERPETPRQKLPMNNSGPETPKSGQITGPKGNTLGAGSKQAHENLTEPKTGDNITSVTNNSVQEPDSNNSEPLDTSLSGKNVQNEQNEGSEETEPDNSVLPDENLSNDAESLRR